MWMLPSSAITAGQKTFPLQHRQLCGPVAPVSQLDIILVYDLIRQGSCVLIRNTLSGQNSQVVCQCCQGSWAASLTLAQLILCLPVSLLPADGAAARTAPGASGAVLLLNPTPAAFHEETPTDPGLEWPYLHLYHKAAPHLWTLKGNPRTQLAFQLSVPNCWMAQSAL